jgi:hypothetical protein
MDAAARQGFADTANNAGDVVVKMEEEEATIPSAPVAPFQVPAPTPIFGEFAESSAIRPPIRNRDGAQDQVAFPTDGIRFTAGVFEVMDVDSPDKSGSNLPVAGSSNV